jgi:serine phosphatase RsbU (regulator of sigma subunit)
LSELDSPIEIVGLPSFAYRSPAGVGEGAGQIAPTPTDPLFHAVSVAASALTGDFYLRLRRQGGWLFGLGDVAGHGLEASVYMMMIQEEIERLAERSDLPLASLVAEVHATMRRELPGTTHDHRHHPNPPAIARVRFASLVLAEVGAGGHTEIVNAGHPPPLLRRADGGIFALPPNGPILGPLPQSRWSSLSTRLRPGDTLLLVSDGILEATSPEGVEFGTERLWSALARDGALPPRELASRLLAEVARFRGHTPPVDDTTIVVLRA